MARDPLFDAMAALRAANPVPEPPSDAAPDDGFVDGDAHDEDRARLAAVLAPSPSSKIGNVRSLAEHRRRHRRTVVTGIAVLGVVMTTAAWAYINNRPAADPMTVLCLNQPETFDSADPNAAVPLQGIAAQFLAGDPFKRCDAAWSKPEFDNQPAQPPPPLVGCVLPSGVLAVMPGSSGTVCDRLGLARWSGRFRDDAAAITKVATELTDWIGTQSCPDSLEAAPRARAALASAGLSKWKLVTVDKPRPGQPCAIYGFDFSKRTISVDYVPPIPR